MGKYYPKYANRLFLGTYIVLLHLCSFYYDLTNVSQALINLDNNFMNVFLHEFVSVMLMALLFTTAIHVPIRLYFRYKTEQEERAIQPVLRHKERIFNIENQPVPGELLKNLCAN